MSKLATVGRALGKVARWHRYGALAGLLIAAVAVRIFWFTDSSTATALIPAFDTLVMVVSPLIVLAIGLQRFVPQPGPSPPWQRQEGDLDGPPS